MDASSRSSVLWTPGRPGGSPTPTDRLPLRSAKPASAGCRSRRRARPSRWSRAERRSGWCCGRSVDGEERPLAGDALELVVAASFEVVVAADEQLPHRLGDPDLARSRQRRNTRADAHGQAARLGAVLAVPDELELAGVDTGAHVEADPLHG